MISRDAIVFLFYDGYLVVLVKRIMSSVIKINLFLECWKFKFIFFKFKFIIFKNII